MTDSELLFAAMKGSEEAFTEIVRRNQARVRAYLIRMVRDRDLADELAQDVFLIAFREMKRFRPGAKVSTWLLGIARNRALTRLRDEARRLRREADTVSTALSAWRLKQLESQPENLDERKRELEAMDLCIDSLPEKTARAIKEYYGRSRSAADLGRTFGMKENAFRMWMFRARQEIRKCVQNRMKFLGA